MNLSSRNFLFSILLLLIASTTYAQVNVERYNKYDELLSVAKSFKPSYNDNYPTWAKKLYAPTFNWNEVSDEFDTYMGNHPTEHSAIIRYFKVLKRSLPAFVLADGTIDTAALQ